MSNDALEALEARARASETDCEWSAAASAWASIAETLGRGGDGGRAARAWDAAGEAWRRDDRPKLANKALNTALRLTDDPSLATIVRVKRSGCFAAQGKLGEARQALYQAMLGPTHSQTVVADGMVDLSLATGDVAAALQWSSRIVGEDALVLATLGFRQAQCHRLNGNLVEADTGLIIAEASLPGLAGRAAVMGERAELLALLGDPTGALDARREAMTLHWTERRMGPWWASLAALVRTAVWAGVVLPTVMEGTEARRPEEALRGALVSANARGLVLVSLDLAISSALLAGDGAALRSAAESARSHGAVLRAGRALYLGVALSLLPPSELDAAAKDVAGVPLWRHFVAAEQGDESSRHWLASRGL